VGGFKKGKRLDFLKHEPKRRLRASNHDRDRLKWGKKRLGRFKKKKENDRGAWHAFATHRRGWGGDQEKYLGTEPKKGAH